MVEQCFEIASESGYYDMIKSSRVGRMSCERATVRAMKDKLVTFSSLRDGLVVTREEFERATEWEDLMNAGLMALRWTKAGCDAFISMAASASSVILPKNQSSAAGFVKSAYKASAAIAKAGSTAAHGSQVDKTVLIRDVKDGVLGMASQNNPKLKLSKMANLQVNIVVDATRGDNTGALLKATGGQLAETAKLTAMWAKELENSGAEKVAKSVAAVTEIATASIKFEHDLTKASEDYLDTKDEIIRRRDSMRRMLNGQLNRIESKIIQLEYNVDECFVPASE